MEAFHLHRTRFELIVERKLRRRQLTDDGNVEITWQDLREKPGQPARAIFSTGRQPPASELRGLRLEKLIALGEGDPGLLAPGPDMPGGSQPGRIVERTRTNAHKAIPRRAGNPRPTFGANPPRVDPPAIGGVLERSRFDSAETKAGLRHDDPQRERAAVKRWQSVQWHV
jgi:hypothetical protein